MEQIENAEVTQSATESIPPSKSFSESTSLIDVLYLVFGAIVIELIFWRIQFTTKSICCGDFDGYYHIRWSQLLWENFRQWKSIPSFIWLPLTTLNPKDYVDHHFLFHVIQIPFTWLGDLTLGAKIEALLFSSLAVFGCYWLIVRYRIKHTTLWLVALLACSSPFLYRLSMAKAPPFAIIFMVVGVYLFFEKKYWLLVPLAFLFALTYSLFVTLVVAAVIWSLVTIWSEDRYDFRSVVFNLRPTVFTLAGSALGFIINPYFPKNVRLFVEHLAIKATVTDFSTAVGSEWYPYESWYFLVSCFIAFVAMFIGYVAFEWTDRKRNSRQLFLLIFSTLLLILSVRSRRFVEYWPPFAVLFAAFTLKPLMDGGRAAIGRLPSDLMAELQPFLDRHEDNETVRLQKRLQISDLLNDLPIFLFLIFCSVFEYSVRTKTLVGVAAVVFCFLLRYLRNKVGRTARVAKAGWATVPAGLAIMLCFPMNLNILAARLEIGEIPEQDRTVRRMLVASTAVTLSQESNNYELGIEWIRKNVPAGERVFNTDWDDFPMMFFYDTTHAYVSGLDPTYLLDQNPELGELYKKITLGEEKDPGPLIRDRFGARYIFSDNEQVHDVFYNNARQSGWFEKVYDDEHCFILRLRDQQGEPWVDNEEVPQIDSMDDDGNDNEPR